MDCELVTLKKWNAVATWSYNTQDGENCAICLNTLTETCIECSVDVGSAEHCLVVWGICST